MIIVNFSLAHKFGGVAACYPSYNIALCMSLYFILFLVLLNINKYNVCRLLDYYVACASKPMTNWWSSCLAS